MVNVDAKLSQDVTCVNAVDGTSIAYEDLGSGDPVILLHGLTETGESWHDAGYVDRLLSLGSRTIVIDCRGHGRSGKPVEPRAYSGFLIARDIAAVMDAAGIGRATLMGYSMGAMSALAMALHFPNRIQAVILNGAHPFAEDLEPFRSIFSEDPAKWLAHLEGLAPFLPDTAKKRILSANLLAIRACIAKNRPDISVDFARLGIPTLAIGGELDPRIDPIRRFGEMDNVRTIVLQDCNHVTAFLATDLVMAGVSEFVQDICEDSKPRDLR